MKLMSAVPFAMLMAVTSVSVDQIHERGLEAAYAVREGGVGIPQGRLTEGGVGIPQGRLTEGGVGFPE